MEPVKQSFALATKEMLDPQNKILDFCHTVQESRESVADFNCIQQAYGNKPYSYIVLLGLTAGLQAIRQNLGKFTHH